MAETVARHERDDNIMPKVGERDLRGHTSSHHRGCGHSGAATSIAMSHACGLQVSELSAADARPRSDQPAPRSARQCRGGTGNPTSHRPSLLVADGTTRTDAVHLEPVLGEVRPMVLACMADGSSHLWRSQTATLWHIDAGSGAVHTIKIYATHPRTVIIASAKSWGASVGRLCPQSTTRCS
jgi:hypothetical protein